MLRSATSALLRTSTEISSICAVSTVRSVRQSPRYLPLNRPFSTSVCLCKRKKKTSLWLQPAEGQVMEGNIEEILAPLRLAVKKQVTHSRSTYVEMGFFFLVSRVRCRDVSLPGSPVHLTGCLWKCQSGNAWFAK